MITQQLESINKTRGVAPEDEHKVIKIGTQNTNEQLTSEMGKNLDQYVIDNPPIKDHGGLMLTEFVIIGDQQTSFDSKFLQQNQVSHILNT